MLEIPGKLTLGPADWLTVQQHLYVGFGVVGGAIEVVSILLTWLVVFAMPRGRSGRMWTLFAALGVTAGLVDWALVVSPMNGVLNAWTAQTIPADWTAVRNRWEIGHAVQAALFLAAFCALIVAPLIERVDRPART